MIHLPFQPEKNIAPSKISILCVDDDSHMLSSLKRMFRSSPLKITIAGSGKKGLRLYKQKKFDIALIDIQMSNMSGIELLEKIRKYDESFPVIMMTGCINDDYLFKSIQLQCDDYVEKPLKKNLIVSKIHRILRLPYES